MNVIDEILNTPHALIAGTTGSGKSVLLNSVICEGLKRDAGFWFVDLKRVELRRYMQTENCLGYVTEPEQVVPFLNGIISEMDDEYERMTAVGLTETDLPHRYLVIDELAYTVGIKGALEKIVTIGRLGRAAHIHMIGATQDPSRYTLSAQLMQNITCAVALKCKTATESRQIIGEAGAEMLPAHGKGYVSTFKGVSMVDIPMTDPEVIAAEIAAHEKKLPAVKAFTPGKRTASVPAEHSMGPLGRTAVCLLVLFGIMIAVVWGANAILTGLVIFMIKLSFAMTNLLTLRGFLGMARKKSRRRW